MGRLLASYWLHMGISRIPQAVRMYGVARLLASLPVLLATSAGVGARSDRLGNFREMQRHGGGVAFRQDQPGGLALGRADGAEQPDRLGALIERSRRAAEDFVENAGLDLARAPREYTAPLRPSHRNRAPARHALVGSVNQFERLTEPTRAFPE